MQKCVTWKWYPTVHGSYLGFGTMPVPKEQPAAYVNHEDGPFYPLHSTNRTPMCAQHPSVLLSVPMASALLWEL